MVTNNHRLQELLMTSNILWDTSWNQASVWGTSGDWVLSAPGEENNVGGLQSIDPLGTAIMIALFTDARLPDYLVGTFGFTIDDQHEWHGNTFGIDTEYGEEPLGSLLWTLRRAPLGEYTARMAERFCSEALQPLVRAKVVSNFDIYSEVDYPMGRLSIQIRTYGRFDREYFATLYPTR